MIKESEEKNIEIQRSNKELNTQLNDLKYLLEEKEGEKEQIKQKENISKEMTSMLDNAYSDFNVLQTYVNGQLVAEDGKSLIDSVFEDQPNNFEAEPILADDLRVTTQGKTLRVIEAYDGQLITGTLFEHPKVVDKNVVSDVANDIRKMVVLNRYEPKAKPAIAFIKNFNIS